MKTYINTIAILLSLLFCFSCKQIERPIIKNLVYFSDAETSNLKDILLEKDAVTNTTITIRLAQKAEKDVTLKLDLDLKYLEEYNKNTESVLKPIAAENITIDKETVIKAGNIVSEPIKIQIKPFATAGASYVAPISIKCVKGGVKLLKSSSRLIVKLNKPLIQKVPGYQWFNKTFAAPREGWNLQLANYTLEWWSKISGIGGGTGYSINNQAIFNSGSSGPGGTEMYIRFGDLIHYDRAKGRYVFNFLQAKLMGSQFDTGNPAEGHGLESDKWYHFAITYDAATGTSIMYKNGIEVARLSTGSGRTMNIDQFQIASSGRQYFKDLFEICQVRLWKSTRTAAQIQKSMYSEVEYTNPDLIMYLPMNEVEGNIFKDVTGHGHDVEVPGTIERKEYEFKK